METVNRKKPPTKFKMADFLLGVEPDTRRLFCKETIDVGQKASNM